MKQKMGYEKYEDQEYKGKEREKKLNKKRNMMRVNGRHLKSVILPLLEKKGKEAKAKSDFSKDRVTKRQSKTFSFDYTY